MKSFIITFFLIMNTLIFSQSITISGAASLKEYLEKNIKAYEKTHNTKFNLNLGSSGTLKKQLEQGAPVDIIFLANKGYIENLKKNGYIENTEDILKNKLVLIKNDNVLGKDITLAIGNPNFVPAGKYAAEVLKNKKLNFNYETIYTKDVRSVLNYVELGEVNYGIVYLTDTKLLKNSKTVEIFNDSLHSPIIYSLGVATDSKMKKESLNFINFLKGKNWND